MKLEHQVRRGMGPTCVDKLQQEEGGNDVSPGAPAAAAIRSIHKPDLPATVVEQSAPGKDESHSNGDALDIIARRPAGGNEHAPTAAAAARYEGKDSSNYCPDHDFPKYVYLKMYASIQTTPPGQQSQLYVELLHQPPPGTPQRSSKCSPAKAVCFIMTVLQSIAATFFHAVCHTCTTA